MQVVKTTYYNIIWNRNVVRIQWYTFMQSVQSYSLGEVKWSFKMSNSQESPIDSDDEKPLNENAIDELVKELPQASDKTTELLDNVLVTLPSK